MRIFIYRHQLQGNERRLPWSCSPLLSLLSVPMSGQRFLFLLFVIRSLVRFYIYNRWQVIYDYNSRHICTCLCAQSPVAVSNLPGIYAGVLYLLISDTVSALIRFSYVLEHVNDYRSRVSTHSDGEAFVI